MGGAGIQADVRTISSLGLHPLTVLTAVTAQNSRSVKAIETVSKAVFQAQLNSILEEVVPDAMKIGMCGSPTIAREIADFISSRGKDIPVVVDPVLKATAGDCMLTDNENSQETIVDIYLKHIFPHSTIITPNLPEAEAILAGAGIEKRLSDSPLEIALKLIEVCGSQALVLKGGHSDDEEITDILVYRTENYIKSVEFIHKRVNTNNLHGTGCVYSSLLATYLASGCSIEESFLSASNRMKEIIGRSCGYKLGISSNGPLDITSYNHLN